MDKVIIREVVNEGEERKLDYRELSKLYSAIGSRAKTFIKPEDIVMHAPIEDMEKGVLAIYITISPTILDRNDYIHSLISEGILWYLRTRCLSAIDIPSSEPPFTHTVESIFDNVNFEYTIELHDGD